MEISLDINFILNRGITLLRKICNSLVTICTIDFHLLHNDGVISRIYA